MPDATYDVILVGAGNKNMALACYLARYGGLKVAIFERRNELGGGLASEECAAPGFISNTHGTSVHDFYALPMEWDFPELKDYLKFVPYRIARGMVFSDGTGVSIHNIHYDPTQEKTAKSIARISPRDAETWLKLYEIYHTIVRPANLLYAHTPADPAGVANPFEKLAADPALHWDPVKKTGIADPSWGAKSQIEVFREVFESEKLIAGFLRLGHSGHGMEPESPGTGFASLLLLMFLQISLGCWQGGSHMTAHALHKIQLKDGVQTFTRHQVEKILVENGRATGVRLTDGSEIAARKAVVSGLDPAGVIHLVGEEHLPSYITRKVAHLQRWHTCITWFFWAVHERPRYIAQDFDPDVGDAGWLAVGQDNPEFLSQSVAWRRVGKMSPHINLITSQHTLVDPTQAPEGKHVVLSEDFVLPANAMSEREWLEFKKSHAEDVINHWKKYAPNMNWDNVIGYTPQTPYDFAGRLTNMAPEGNWAVIDQVPSQMGRWRPIPEWAQYRLSPIKDLYGCSAAWHPFAGMMVNTGYNCYKVMAEDYGLGKPWEEDGRPF